MDKSEAQKWIDSNIENLMTLFGIPHWRIDVFLETIYEKDGSFSTIAICQSKPEREKASITIDYTQISDEEHLEQVTKHELLHIMHSPFDLFWDVVSPYLDGLLDDSLGKVFQNACESTVRNLERLHQGHINAKAESKADDPAA